MAVITNWMSSAVADTGQRSMLEARKALGLPAAGMLSEMIGKSMGHTLVMTVQANRPNGEWWGNGDELMNQVIDAEFEYTGTAPIIENKWIIPAGVHMTLFEQHYEINAGCDFDPSYWWGDRLHTFVIQAGATMRIDPGITNLFLLYPNFKLRVENHGSMTAPMVIGGTGTVVWAPKGTINGAISPTVNEEYA
ncbi:hypothetical protein [Edwardsiella tarda]|uniref:hypothetical protein n=1 Tax=Edwardsiella tarda TaxID=636 RepID=UPI00083B8E67|nr:hypothetical protein [Edwardsiella tarda]